MADDDADVPNARVLDDGRMPFFEHLQELRDRLRNAVIAFIIGFVGCWFFAERIYDWLREPMNAAWINNSDKLGKVPMLAFAKPTEPFWVYMSTAMWAGIFVSSPFIFYQLWRFVAPGLYKSERKVGLWFAVPVGDLLRRRRRVLPRVRPQHHLHVPARLRRQRTCTPRS